MWHFPWTMLSCLNIYRFKKTRVLSRSHLVKFPEMSSLCGHSTSLSIPLPSMQPQTSQVFTKGLLANSPAVEKGNQS